MMTLASVSQSYFRVLPNEMALLLTDYLDLKSIKALHQAFPDWQRITLTAREVEYQQNRQAFLDRYGAIADSEAEADPKELEKETRLSSWDRAYYAKRASHWVVCSSFKERYRLYRGEDFQRACTELVRTAKRQKGIAQELKNKPLDRAHPLQDLRDRYVRLRTLKRQARNIDYCFGRIYHWDDRFLNDLSSWERIVFRIISFLHSICLPKPRCLAPICNARLGVSWRKLLSQSVCLGDGRVQVKGHAYPIEILGRLELYRDNPKRFTGGVIFDVICKENQNKIGALTIYKQWDKLTSYGSTTQFREDYEGLPNRPLFNPHLSGELRVCNPGLDDEEARTCPVERILTQLGVEVLQREPRVTKLSMESYGDSCHVLVASGFRAPYQSTNEEILHEICEARQQGYLFHRPENRRWSSSDFDIIKGQLSNPVVDYQPKAKPKSWEEVIAASPLLTKVTGPVLPKFLHRDLSVYEKRGDKQTLSELTALAKLTRSLYQS